MRNEVAVRNGRDIKNTQNENYTVEEIAEKIVEDHNYLVQLSEGVLQVVKYNSKYHFFHIDYSRKIKVYKGQKLGAYRDGDYDKIDVKATHDGFFEPDLSNFYWEVLRETRFKGECDLVIGKIFFPEYDFFRDNERKIDNAVKKIKESKKQALEIEEQAKRDDEQRKKDKLLKDQNESIDDIDDLLKDLDKYILDNKLPVIETLQEINNDLKVLYAQKNNLIDVKSIKDCKSHFENAYKEAKKNSELTDIIEQRMLVILRTFYEILGESKEVITTKILSSKIREFEVIVENNEPVKIELLQTLEDLIKELVKQKDIIQDKTEIENIKVHFDAIFKDFKKKKDFSNSASLRMQEIEKSFDDILGKKKGFLARIFGK